MGITAFRDQSRSQHMPLILIQNSRDALNARQLGRPEETDLERERWRERARRPGCARACDRYTEKDE
ncbi:hypothetical protein QTP86_015057, partial [Hemibagrus guttatus]